MQNMRDVIVSKTNYSKIQSAVSCTGLELASSCKRKKRVAQQVLHWRSSVSVLSGTSCHILMLQWVQSPSIARFLSLALPLSHPDVHSALNLSSFCCCIINLACLNLIGLSLTSQSIAQIPLLLPRVFSRSGTNNKSLASSLTKYFSLFYLCWRKIVQESPGSKRYFSVSFMIVI